jgi:tetratricopeptide (TPR) repeat protein
VDATRGSDRRETIGQRLRRLRLARGLSQRELAGPGVSYAYISRIEAGARQPSVKALRTLSPKLAVSVEYLETGSDLNDDEERELRVTNAELTLRLDERSEDAEQTLRTALGEAVSVGDEVSATRARIALGLAAAREGHDADAVALLEAATASELVTPATSVSVYATLGRCYAAQGNPERAIELLEDCLAQAHDNAPDEVAAHVRYTTYLGNALTDVGETERADSLLQDLLSDGSSLADPHTRVRLYWGMGRVVADQGNTTAALDYLRRAMAMLEATEDTVQLARAHLMCAWIFVSSQRPHEAVPHLELAEQLLGPHPEPLDVAYLRTEQAKCAVQLGDPARAVEAARQALDVLGDSDPHEQGSAWFALAQGLALDSAQGDAHDAFRRASSLLEEHGRPHEAAAALRAWARLLRDESREAEALDVLDRAAELSASTRSEARPAPR